MTPIRGLHIMRPPTMAHLTLLASFLQPPLATAMVLQDSDPAYSQTLMKTSTLLYGAGTRRRASYTNTLNYPCATTNASSNMSGS